MKVTLLSYTKDPEKIVAAAIRQCYSSDSALNIKNKLTGKERARLIKMVVGSGHTSTIEHVSFTFGVEEVSRVLTHELVRHRIASYSQQSQRYISGGKFGFVTPPTIHSKTAAKKIFEETIEELGSKYEKLIEMGIPKEDARFVLPNATDVKIVVTMNARSLFNFLSRRMCNRAQWEIRRMAYLFHKELMKVAPKIFRYAGPSCKTEGICWEGERHCGLPDKDKSIQLRSHVK
ncbi:MAG: FAD-dependent thymidylate synthase [Patescibacteria group bacterium]